MRLAQETWNANGTNAIDGRTRFGKDFAAALRGYSEERSLLTAQGDLDRAAAGQTVADMIELASYLKADIRRRYANYVKCGLQRRSNGDLHPCPACEKALYTPVNTFARILERLHVLSPPGRRELSLQEYIRRNYPASASQADTSTRGQTAQGGAAEAQGGASEPGAGEGEPET